MVAPLTLILAQINPTVGDIKANANRMLQIWEEHDEQDTLVIFPELALSGYPPEDLILNHNFQNAVEEEINKICAQSENLNAAAIIPTPWKENGNIYNAALLIQNGKIQHVCKKHDLPNYAVFDEKRIFKAADMPNPIELNEHKIGLLICEDIWNSDIPKHLKSKGAEILISINASPFTKNKAAIRQKITSKAIDETGLDVVYLNLVGGQDELVFDGSSFVQTADKKIIYQAPGFEEAIFKFQYENGQLTASENKPTEEIIREEKLYKAATLGLHDYVHKNGFKKVLIGLSGGIDSALTAAMAIDAFGKDNVHCIMMPSEFTSSDSLKDAKECANLLGVEYDIIPIEEALKEYEELILNLSGLAHENTQSRIRGTILMALSNASGAMVITTGNKSEMAVGYCTLYGDMNGGFNPLKDIYKTDVYALSKWRNNQGTVIPENIITKEPSAELRADQTDQDSLPPYDLLDTILKCLVEYDSVSYADTPESIQRMMDECAKHPETVSKIAKLLKITEYKRFQAPPGPRLTEKAFTDDRRYPMTNGFTNAVAK